MLQQQLAGDDLERHLAAQVGHVRLREAVGGVARRELRERAREHAAVAAVHLLRDVLGTETGDRLHSSRGVVYEQYILVNK